MKILRPLFGVVLLGILATSADRAQAQYFPPGHSKAGGIRDLMLIYLSKTDWTAKDFLPYVAYLDKSAAHKPLDWFYDSYLFLAYGGAPSGKQYIDGATNKADWEYYFDNLLFCQDRSLHALQTCLRQVEGQLGPRGRKIPIIIMIPYPSAAMRNFGDVDGDGRSEDLSKPVDREKAVRWCVDEILRRWKQADFSAFSLWGFYWMNEGIGPADEAIVRATADYVHKCNYGLHWIPYFHSPGSEKCDQLGIDFAILQPNYAFMEQGGRRPEEQRLSQTAFLAKRDRLGIEIEMMDISNQTERNNLWDYLIHGQDRFDGYMRGAVHGYYQGTYSVAKLCYSKQPAYRSLYDAMYRFAKGTLDTQRTTLSRNTTYRLSGKAAAEYPDDGKRLTDGRFAATVENAGRIVGLLGDRPQIEIDLGDARRIAGVELRVLVKDPKSQTARKQATSIPIDRPKSIEVATSMTGASWEPAGCGYRWFASELGGTIGGPLCHDFPSRDARYVRITLAQQPGAMTLTDEVTVQPAASLTDGSLYTLTPAPIKPDTDGSLLTDGLYAGSATSDRAIGWAAGQEGTIHLELCSTRHVGLIRAHVPSVEGTGPEAIERAVVATRADASAAWQPAGQAVVHGNFLDVDADAPLAREVRVTLTPRPGRAVLLDEIEVYVAENLARGKPYEIVPAHPEKYGDPGRKKLTDGILCERGFGDKRTVGWMSQDVEVILDLGQEQSIDGVRAHLEGGGVGAVDFPPRMDILISPDARRWTWIDSISSPPATLLVDRPAGHAREQLGWMAWRGSPVQARFVMYRFAANQWTMISEIEVLSQGRNVAPGKNYHLRPAPASSAPYSDATGKLTDGMFSTSGFGQGRVVGWNAERPAVTVDLGLPVEVTRVTAHVVGGGRAGVWFPVKMSVAVSSDGQQWTKEVVTTQRPPEPTAPNAQESLQGHMTVEIPKQSCRYVRVQFDRRGWLMLDEIEVFGPKAPAKK